MGEHQLTELPEEVAGVVRTRRRLGVVLHGEGRRTKRPEALDHPVVEVDVRGLGVGNGTGRHGVVVVLAGDLHEAGRQALYRMVGAVVPEGQLVRPAAERGGQELVAQADTEDRYPAHQVGDRPGRPGQGRRVTGPVGEEDAVGVEGEHLVRSRRRGHDRHGPEACEQTDHGGLHPEVVGDDPQPVAGRAWCTDGAGTADGGGTAVGAGLERRDPRDEVQAVGADGRLRRQRAARLRAPSRTRRAPRPPRGRGGRGAGCRPRSARAPRGGAGRARGPRSSASWRAPRQGRTR